MTNIAKPFGTQHTGLVVEHLSYDDLTRCEQAIFFPNLTVLPVPLLEGNGITEDMATARGDAEPTNDAPLPGREHLIGYTPPSKE